MTESNSNCCMPEISIPSISNRNSPAIIGDVITIPPPQDSSKNIVNILNDDCLQAILREIDTVRDFWNAAEVCTRFQENSKICFPFKWIGLRYEPYNPKFDLLFDDAERFLSIFGSKIKSISCELVNQPENAPLADENNLNLIAKYCGKTLIQLKIRNERNDNFINLKWPFQVLKVLELIYDNSFQGVDYAVTFPELEILNIRKMANWITNNYFPKLKHVSLPRTLTTDAFIEFQNRHPQIQSLFLFNSENFTSSVWEGIGDRMPNIVSLHFRDLEEIGSVTVDISTLRCLKILYLYSYYRAGTVDSILSTCIEYKHPIEELHIGRLNNKRFEILQKFETLKKLYVVQIADEVAIELAKKLPALQYLELSKIKLSTIKGILEHGKQLTELNMYTCSTCSSLEFNLELYSSIVALATARRVKIKIFYWPSPTGEDILRQVSIIKTEWIRFIKKVDNGYGYSYPSILHSSIKLQHRQ